MVSVIITTCRREPKIVERAINSIINQTYKDWELIVINDSPDDFINRTQLEQDIQDYKERYNIVYVVNKENYGACFSRNVGLNLAKGEYIAYLDDDDEWLPEKLEKQVLAISEAGEQVCLVYNPFYRIIDTTKETSFVELPLLSGMLYEELMQRGNFIGGMSIPLMKTEYVRKIGGFDNLMQSSQDYDLFVRLSQHYKITSIENPLVYYHIHNGEQISSNPQRKIAGIERLLEKNSDYMNKHKEVKWRNILLLIRYSLIANNKKKAINNWIFAVTLCPLRVTCNIKELARIVAYRKN